MSYYINNHCHFCQSFLDDLNTCFNCPTKVKHYFDEDGLFCVELYHGKYAVDIYFNGVANNQTFIINIETHLNDIRLPKNHGITPSNIKEKLQLFLTFQ